MAKINCSKHGSKGVFLVSPEIGCLVISQVMQEELNIKEISIEAIFGEAKKCWVTEGFTSKYNDVDFDNVITLDILEKIEDTEDDFYSELKPVCSACFDELIGR